MKILIRDQSALCGVIYKNIHSGMPSPMEAAEKKCTEQTSFCFSFSQQHLCLLFPWLPQPYSLNVLFLGSSCNSFFCDLAQLPLTSLLQWAEFVLGSPLCFVQLVGFKDKIILIYDVSEERKKCDCLMEKKMVGFSRAKTLCFMI